MASEIDNAPVIATRRDEAARAIVEEIRAHKRPFPETVYLVDNNDEMVDAFTDALRNAQQNL